MASCSIQTFGHNKHGSKIGGCVPLGEGELGPPNTMSPRLRPTSVPSGILIHPAVTTQQTWAEIWGLCFYFWGAGSPSNTKSFGSRPTSIPSGILIHSAIWPQRKWAENWGLCPLWVGELGPHLTQCGRGRGLSASQVSS